MWICRPNRLGPVLLLSETNYAADNMLTAVQQMKAGTFPLEEAKR